MYTLLIAIVTFILGILIWRFMLNSKSPFTSKSSSIPFDNRDYVEYKDLLDPKIRADPHKFNQHIYHNIISKSSNKSINAGIIPVRGEKNTFLICKYHPIKQILVNEKIYSSNPFPDERLIAPNAMDDKPHKVIMKYLKKYYSASTISKQIPAIEKIIQQITQNFLHRQRINKQIDRKRHTSSLGYDAMHGLSKLIVMKTALFMLGIPSKQYNNSKIIHTLIKFNDEMVRIIAPQGGIGYKIHFTLQAFINVIFGLVFALIPTIRLIITIGIRNSWNILRPDLNVFRLPNMDKDNGSPRTQMWIYPYILYRVPQYFLYLNDLYERYGVALKYPNRSEESNVIDGRNVLQSLYDAERKGDMTRCEVLVTIVQLMVNMTTANAIGNMLYRISTWSDETNDDGEHKGLLLKDYLCDDDGVYDEDIAQRLIEEVLRYDAPLQRLPRRCRVNVNDFYGEKFPKNSTLILMIGLGNCDEKVFGNKGFEFIPDRYKDKDIGKALSFGYGIHLCLGYLLVKREMNLTLKALVDGNIKKISLKSLQRVVDIDVGNYGFNTLFVELHES